MRNVSGFISVFLQIFCFEAQYLSVESVCKILEPVLECHEANFETGDGYRVGHTRIPLVDGVEP